MQEKYGFRIHAMAGIAVGLLVFAINPSMAGDIYKTVDAYGNVVYTDTPPRDDQNVQRLQRKTHSTDLEYVSRVNKQLTASRNATEDRKLDKTNQNAKDTDIAEQRAANCDKARKRSQTAERAHRMYDELGDGERRYYTSEEQDNYKAKTKADIAEWCN